MTVTAPDWLVRHGGELRAGKAWLIYLSGEPQYLLVPTPAAGKFSCRVTQTINGQRLDSATTYPSAEDAVRGGLEDLRKALGW